jgi:hypothetical protein
VDCAGEITPSPSSLRICLNLKAANIIDNCLIPAIDVRPVTYCRKFDLIDGREVSAEGSVFAKCNSAF